VGAEGGQALFRRGTGRFTAAATGTYTVRVYDPSNTPGPLPFRIYVYAIDTLPESLPPVLALNTSVAGEILDLPGDIDEFTLTVAADTLINLALFKPAADSARPVLYLMPAGSEAPTTIVYSPFVTGGPGELAGLSGGLHLGAGVHRVRIDGGTGARDETGGPYRIQSWGLSPEPEGVPSTIAVGDVIDEASSPAGDADRYQFAGAQGQLINLTLQGTAGPSPAGDRVAYLMRSGVPGPSLIAVAFSALNSAPPGGQTGRVHLPADGQYDILVFPNGDGVALAETGSYRLSLLPVDAAPEHVAVTLPASGGITGEAIDSSGDIDRFTITAAPGAEFEITSRFSSRHFNMKIETLMPTGDAPDRSGPMPDYEFPLGRFVVPPSGKLRLQVYEDRYGFYDGYTGTGEYTVTFVPIHRAPESIAAAAPRNAVVQGERIDPIGDVDEFTFAGTAGEQLRAYFNTPQGVITGGTLTMEVVEAATGDVLGSVVSGNSAVDIHDQGTGLLTLPSSGTYLIRVRGTVDTNGAALYEFLIAD
jgi:hypothetical protein